MINQELLIGLGVPGFMGCYGAYHEWIRGLIGQATLSEDSMLSKIRRLQ